MLHSKRYRASRTTVHLTVCFRLLLPAMDSPTSSLEISQNFKEQGNDYFKGKRYREAIGFYTQGLDAKPTDSMLQEALYCNRAACNLELSMWSLSCMGALTNNVENYGLVLKDCSRALSVNAKSPKALYRSASALLALDRLEEALDCCDRCLVFDPHNQVVQSLRSRAENAKKAKDRQHQENEERIRREKEERQLLRIAFKVSKSLPFSIDIKQVGRNDTSTLPAVHRGHRITRILRTLTLTILLGRRSSSQSSFCTLSMRHRMSLRILWKIRLSTLIFLRCSRHKRLHRAGTKTTSTRPVTL